MELIQKGTRLEFVWIRLLLLFDSLAEQAINLFFLSLRFTLIFQGVSATRALAK